jgi:tetratricopeptide (TPR) repeat protein
MPSDPQNKAASPDSNVVALHRAEFVASLDKKLSEARRFFSLHDYASCLELVREVLAADPQNAKAKALHDLSAIKLSKRKLYKKIAGTQPSPPPSNGSAVTNTLLAPPVSLAEVENSRAEPDSQFSLPEPHPHVIEPPPRRRRGLPESGATSTDSMRERTISALVDLLKNKDTTLEDWKDDYQAETGSPTPPTSAPSPEPMRPVNTGTSSPRVQPSPPVNQHLTTEPSEDQQRAVLKANRDFLPVSLDELFEAKPDKTSRLSPADPQPRLAPAGNIPRKNVPPPTALSAPPKNSTKTARPLQGTLPVAPGAIPKKPEVSSQTSPLLSQPPTAKNEAVKQPVSGSPVSAPPSEPSPTTHRATQPPDIRIFDQITAPRPLVYQKEVERERRSEETKNSEIQAGAVAQIKKYLYQEEYDLCAHDLAKIRDQFPQNPDIQAFVENTSKRLVELQRIKKFEVQAKDLMASAISFYQEGKREEALIAVREILRVNPNHVQAREFVSFVERHQGKKKQPTIQKVRACRSCGSEVDAVSQFCCNCGKRLG